MLQRESGVRKAPRSTPKESFAHHNCENDRGLSPFLHFCRYPFQARCARTTEAPRIRGDTEWASARHGSGPRKDSLRGFGRDSTASWTDTEVPSPFLRVADIMPTNPFTRIITDLCDFRPFFRALFRVGGSRFRVGGGMSATKWLTMAGGATHELARADAARPIATRAWRGRHSTRRFRGKEMGTGPVFHFRPARRSPRFCTATCLPRPDAASLFEMACPGGRVPPRRFAAPIAGTAPPVLPGRLGLRRTSGETFG